MRRAKPSFLSTLIISPAAERDDSVKVRLGQELHDMYFGMLGLVTRKHRRFPYLYDGLKMTTICYFSHSKLSKRFEMNGATS